MCPELKHLRIRELLAAFRERRPKLRPPLFLRDSFCDEVAYELVKRGTRGIESLLNELESCDELKFRSALCALSSVKATTRHKQLVRAISRVVKSAFRDQRPFIKAEALGGFVTLKIRVKMAEVAPLLESKTPYLATKALTYVCELYPQCSMAALGAALKSAHFLVRETAVDEIDDRHLVQFLPAISRLRRDRHSDVRQAVETAWRHLCKS